MTMTKDEIAWVKKVQRLLSNPPSDRFGFFTVGDHNVTIYDASRQDEIDEAYESKVQEFCSAVEDCDAHLGELIFPNQVHSTAG